MNNERGVAYFYLGCAVGAAVAVILTPKSSEEIVEYLRQKMNRGADYTKRKIDEAQGSVNQAAQRARKAVSDEADGLSAAVRAGKEAYRRAEQSGT
jgi:gas vesicle protein